MDKRIIVGGVLAIVVIMSFVYFSRNVNVKNVAQYIRSVASTTDEIKVSTSTNTEADGVESNYPQYIEVVDSCGPYYVGECVNMRNGPGEDYKVVGRLRNGVVLKVGEIITNASSTWYKIIFTSQLLYPDRVKGDWYVKAGPVRLFRNIGDVDLKKSEYSTSTQSIIVDVSEQKLYAYDGDVLFMEEPISTGLEFTPTPRGKFAVFRKTPSRFMQGPIPGVSEQVYDLPGVPWNMYFTASGAVIHGAYWHDHFGKPWSHGCVNLSPINAKKLYDWALIGVEVTVQN